MKKGTSLSIYKNLYKKPASRLTPLEIKRLVRLQWYLGKKALDISHSLNELNLKTKRNEPWDLSKVYYLQGSFKRREFGKTGLSSAKVRKDLRKIFKNVVARHELENSKVSLATKNNFVRMMEDI